MVLIDHHPSCALRGRIDWFWFLFVEAASLLVFFITATTDGATGSVLSTLFRRFTSRIWRSQMNRRPSRRGYKKRLGAAQSKMLKN
jgi:hypothetical protein